jgi:hypothetical protein
MIIRRIEGLDPRRRRQLVLEATIWGSAVIVSITAAILFFTKVVGVWVLVIAPAATLALHSVRYWMQNGPRMRRVKQGDDRA